MVDGAASVVVGPTAAALRELGVPGEVGSGPATVTVRQPTRASEPVPETFTA